MDDRSEKLLATVHPDLAKVIRAAAQIPQPFVVVYGVRTVEAERVAVDTGHSTTMHSRHLPGISGLGFAVDVAAIIDGKLSWAPGHEESVFGKIAGQIKSAAIVHGVGIDWGGDWKSFHDYGHFELRWKDYPPETPIAPSQTLQA